MKYFGSMLPGNHLSDYMLTFCQKVIHVQVMCLFCSLFNASALTLKEAIYMQRFFLLFFNVFLTGFIPNQTFPNSKEAIRS